MIKDQTESRTIKITRYTGNLITRAQVRKAIKATSAKRAEKLMTTKQIERPNA